MKKEKDIRLINIYIKIHNKANITMDDLAYLARYNPTCFKKTCDNLIYKVPEAKTLVNTSEKPAEPEKKPDDAKRYAKSLREIEAEERAQNELMIRQFMESLKKMESNEISPLQGIDVTGVKELLGDLYMENLLSQSKLQGHFEVGYQEPKSVINVRV